MRRDSGAQQLGNTLQAVPAGMLKHGIRGPWAASPKFVLLRPKKFLGCSNSCAQASGRHQQAKTNRNELSMNQQLFTGSEAAAQKYLGRQKQVARQKTTPCSNGLQAGMERQAAPKNKQSKQASM
jgi:hypothetical protein